jgi:hypothetical protein
VSILCAFAGVLTADAKPRTSQSGKTWTSLNLRVGYGDQTQWCSVAVFGDHAAAVTGLKEGAGIFVEGRIELRRKNHAGHDMAGLNVAASFCRPIDLQPKKKPHSGRERAAQSPYAPAEPDDEIDF